MKTNRREFLAAGALSALFAAMNGGCRSLGKGAAARRLAVNASTIRDYRLPLLEQVRVVAASGFRGFEPWLKDIHAAVADGSFAKVKALVAETGLEIVNGIGFSEWCAEVAGVRAKALVELKGDMELLGELGCHRIAASMFGVHRPGSPLLPASTIAERFVPVMKLGDETGVKPLLEYWGHSVNLSTPEQALEVLSKTGRTDGAILADVYHTYRGGGAFGVFSVLSAAQLPVLHVNDYPFDPPRSALKDADRVWPGDGHAPWRSLFAALDSTGADPWLSVELFRGEYCTTTPAATLAAGVARFDGLETKNALRLGVQMWSVNDLWKADPAKAFRRLRAMGYEGVQSFGFYAMDWNELGKMLDGEGLRIIDMPFYLKTVATDSDFAKFIDFCRRFGIDFAYEPSFSHKADEATWRRHVAELAALKPKFAAAGIRMGFHNHQIELTRKFADGSCPLDLFERAGLDFELDVGHLKLAGADPVKWLQRVAGRVPTIHAKPGGGDSVGGPGDANDWNYLLPEAAASGAKWAIVECETRRNTFEDVEKSIAELKRLMA